MQGGKGFREVWWKGKQQDFLTADERDERRWKRFDLDFLDFLGFKNRPYFFGFAQ